MPDQVIRVSNGASLIVRTGAILGVGPRGPVGPEGPPGPIGAAWVQGPLGPGGALPLSTTPQKRPLDLWVHPIDGTVWRWEGSSGDTGTWVNQGYSIMGPASSQGFPTFNDLLPATHRH